VFDGALPASLSECDHYIVTGRSPSVYDDRPWIAKLNGFLRALLLHADPLGPKAVGVCFGHQAAALVLNNTAGVGKSAVGWGVGLREVQLLPASQQHEWMQPRVASVRMCFSHQDVVQHLQSLMKAAHTDSDWYPINPCSNEC